MTTLLRVRCDRCPRYGSVGPGLDAEDLEAAGWRVVRDEAICPACLAEPRALSGPGHRLSGRTDPRAPSRWWPSGDRRSRQRRPEHGDT